jgi:hypothetical protein
MPLPARFSHSPPWRARPDSSYTHTPISTTRPTYYYSREVHRVSPNAAQLNADNSARVLLRNGVVMREVGLRYPWALRTFCSHADRVASISHGEKKNTPPLDDSKASGAEMGNRRRSGRWCSVSYQPVVVVWAWVRCTEYCMYSVCGDWRGTPLKAAD